MIRLDVVGPGLDPVLRPAEPVDCRPSLRALYTSHSTVRSTPRSMTRFLRVGRPSPSNGRDPGPRAMCGSSSMVTSSDATA